MPKLALGVLAGAGTLLALVAAATAHAATPTGGPKGTTFVVKGRSGQQWVIERLASSTPDAQILDVWATLPGGERPAATLGNGEPAPVEGTPVPATANLFWWRIARYRQTGSDTSSRRFLGSPWALATPLVRAAIQDFGLEVTP